MEYILIFISAIFVNNIVLSQFLGICPFLGVSKKVETALGMSAGGFRAYHCNNRNVPHSEVCARCFRFRVSSNHHLYPCDCRIGADGGNYPEKSIPFFISGFRCVLAFDYDELLYSRCSYSRYPERLRFADRCGLRILHCPWLWFSVDTLCGFTRTDELGKHTERHAGNSDSFDYRRFAGYGIYGLLRCS